MFFSVSAASLVGFGLFACAAATDAPADDQVSSDDESLVTCANVRCMAGSHCVSRHHKVSCVKDTNACPPNNKACMLGYHYDNTPGVCTCVADAECKSNADCRVEADYCTGCNCLALAPNEKVPACTGPGVRCFADPCMTKTAVCSKGQCVTN